MPRMYRFGITPWERYRTTATGSIAALLDREEAERSRPFGLGWPMNTTAPLVRGTPETIY